MPYATPEQSRQATELGFTETRDQKFGSRFQKDNLYIWPVQDGWQTAFIIDGYYTEHQKFDSLNTAFKRSLNQ